MRFSSSSVLLFAGAVLASEAQHDCLVKHSQDLAEYADCGHQGSLAQCLSDLQSLKLDDIRSCYATVGCSPIEADEEAKATVKRCQELANNGELRKRFRAAPLPNVVGRADTTSTSNGIMSSTACFSTGKKSTTSCEVTTSSGHVSTGTCVPIQITTSECKDSLVCTTDSSGNDICMDVVRMDIGGIIVSLVFAGALVLGIAGLTFACCKDRKEQKRLVAKAEAVALARAATKKQRAAQRQPLIRNPSGGSNPFQDARA